MDSTITASSPKSAILRTYLQWLKFPTNAIGILFVVLPIIGAQILQKLYPIADNHFITILGTQALLIHNIQYSFINLGQYIGSATAISFLIFWKRKECIGQQKSIFVIHLGFCLLASLLCMFIAAYYTDEILSHFSVEAKYYDLAKTYFRCGLMNMVLQAVYLSLMGVVIASSKERLSLVLSVTSLILGVLIDSIAIHIIFSGSV